MQNKAEAISDFKDLTKEFGRIFLRKSSEANQISKKMTSIAREILSAPDGIKIMSKLTDSDIVFIAGWSLMIIISLAELSASGKKMYIENLKLLKEGHGGFSSIVHAFLVGNGYDKVTKHTKHTK